MKRIFYIVVVWLLVAFCPKASAQFTEEFDCDLFTDVENCDLPFPILHVEQEIFIYPNPTDYELLCNVPDEVVELYDVAGRLVKRFQGHGLIYDLPQGIYIAKMKGKKQKIVKF